MKILFRYLMLAGLAICFGILQAQEYKAPPRHARHACKMSLEEHEKAVYANSVRAEKQLNREGRDGIYNLPVQFHIVRTSNGTGGITAADATWELAQANVKYSWMGVEFFECSPANFIDDDFYFNTIFEYDWEDFCGATTPEYLLANENNVGNVVNIYYVNTDGWNWSSFPHYLQDYCKDWIILNIADTGTTYLLAHELGHYFNLLHTFQDYGDSDPDNNEHITRDPDDDCYNCGEYGDWLCDTPADNNEWDTNCNWNGTGSDGCSSLDFEPDDLNIMSYSDCPHNFTDGQTFRVHNAILTTRDYLNCPLLSDCDPVQSLEMPQNGRYAFQASNYITSTAEINPGADADYDAQNYILLQPGFHAKTGCEFDAFLDGCWGPVIFK